MPIVQGRRRFLSSLALVGAAGLGGTGAVTLGGTRSSVAAEPPPEITTIRFEKDPVACIAPPIADELLRAEGFTDIRYVEPTEAHVRRADAANISAIDEMIVSGEVDFGRDFVPSHIATLDTGRPITLIAGLHSACFEVLGRDDIRSIADLKGRTVGDAYGSGDLRLLKIMASLVGLDPAKDIRWVASDRGPTGPVHRGQNRCIRRPTATITGGARPQYRPRDRKQHHRSTMVGVFLLHVGDQHGVCPEISGRDPPRAAGNLEGR